MKREVKKGYLRGGKFACWWKISSREEKPDDAEERSISRVMSWVGNRESMDSPSSRKAEYTGAVANRQIDTRLEVCENYFLFSQ